MSARDALHARLYKGPNENRDDLLDAYRAEVLAEAADVAREETHRLEAGNQDARAARGARSVAYLLRRLAEAGQDTGGQAPAGEPTQPAQVWYLFEEDTPYIATPRLYATKAAAEQGTIERYQAAGEYSPDYSWRPHEDGAHELLAGGDPVGIYLAPATVNGDTAGLSAPDFFHPGRTYTRPSHGRTATFQVTHVSTAPDGSTTTAFGWCQIEGYDTWQDYSSEDFENGWTEGGDAR
jgi:hypothetical protein